MNKLTKPQIAFLKEAAAENGYTCIDRYAPMIKLHELGFVTVSSEGFSTVRAKATKAGRAILATPTPSDVVTDDPFSWCWRHRGSNALGWQWSLEKPTGPSIHLFEVQPLYTRPSPASAAVEVWQGIAQEARFLLDRLEELDDANDAEYIREFEGHVRPPMSRLRRLLPRNNHEGSQS
jgi:hypothetical protein